jgi:prepilin-type N-terminal cleavage/methylation domain-containing protein
MKMGQSTKRFLGESGFSLIELLVVISIIVMLIAMLSTGIQAVKKHATNLRQKSNFHAIEVGLELFQKDYDDYPPSEMIDKKSDGSPGLKVCGAQHLAEALVGRDMKGFDPESNWYAPFIELKKMGAFVMHDLYDNYDQDAKGVYSTDDYTEIESFRAPVITDIFRQKKITRPDPPYEGRSEWVGTPILYYKANSSSRLFKKIPESTDGPDEFDKWIYNYEDNRAIINLGKVKDPTVMHHFNEGYIYTEDTQQRDGIDLFYKTITNPKVNYDKPFNAATFILISAGYDGIYGTSDDITSFDY